MRARTEVSRRELAGCVALGVVLALALHWPLPLHLGHDIPKDVGDPLVQTWEVAWDGHALLHHPLSWFQANTFWPLPDTLAFSDALVGYAPAGLIGSGVHAAVVRYDLLFLFAYALCFVGAWLLARELGAGRAGAAVAGAAFAYAPWRLEQDGHLHVISSGGIPLTAFLLLRGYRRGSPRTILAGWLVAAWQISLGFSLGLPLGYGLLGAALVVAVAWWRRGRPPPPRPLAIATVAGVLVCLVVTVLLARPYLRVLHDHPEARRTTADVAFYSGPPREFLAASSVSRVWGGATRSIRNTLDPVPEQTLFPGLAIFVLALAGLWCRTLSRRLRIGLGVAAVAFAMLSLGFQLGSGAWLWPYRWLYEVIPGWQAIRVPGRLQTGTTLCLALLAAGGAQALIDRLGGHQGAAVAVALTAAVVVEGWGWAPHPAVPTEPAGQHGVPTPTLHLPLGAFDNRDYVLWSTDGFPQIVNGRGSFIPRQFKALMAPTSRFPDAASVALLRRLGVRSVVAHPGSRAMTASGRDLNRLGLTRERRGRVVVFLLR
jgi:hypothetical protein